MIKPKIVIIVGPTASGKTSLSIAIAKKFNGEVISADSRQVYRDLDIGTEKVLAEEMDGVVHHLLDVVDVEQVYTAADFVRDADAAIDTITANGNLPIVAGGTFFYVDALLGRKILPEVSPNTKLRAELEQKNSQSLYSALQKLDPHRAAQIDKDNKRRLIRALEIVQALGQVPTNRDAQPDCRYDALIIGIETDRTELRARIRARAESALERGLIDETKQLLDDGVSRERLSEIGLEYPLVIQYIDKVLTKQELIQKLEEKNWQYAKRQLTWLKRDEAIEWFRPENRFAIFRRIHTFLS